MLKPETINSWDKVDNKIWISILSIIFNIQYNIILYRKLFSTVFTRATNDVDKNKNKSLQSSYFIKVFIWVTSITMPETATYEYRCGS